MTKQNDEIKFFTTKQIAKILNISVVYVKKKVDKGDFPNVKKCQCGQESWLIPEKDLLFDQARLKPGVGRPRKL